MYVHLCSFFVYDCNLNVMRPILNLRGLPRTLLSLGALWRREIVVVLIYPYFLGWTLNMFLSYRGFLKIILQDSSIQMNLMRRLIIVLVVS